MLADYGNSLIEGDLKRLRKLVSLRDDLAIHFRNHDAIFTEHGNLSCLIAHNEEFNARIGKERIAVPSAGLTPAKGCRLWFVITPSGKYIRCLLYQAKEEAAYTSDVCKREVLARLRSIADDVC